MREYNPMRLRRLILADSKISDTDRRHMIIIVEHVDWPTGIKTFEYDQHFTAWIKSLAWKYNSNADAITDGLVKMLQTGYAKMDGTRLELARVGAEK